MRELLAFVLEMGITRASWGSTGFSCWSITHFIGGNGVILQAIAARPKGRFILRSSGTRSLGSFKVVGPGLQSFPRQGCAI